MAPPEFISITKDSASQVQIGTRVGWSVLNCCTVQGHLHFEVTKCIYNNVDIDSEPKQYCNQYSKYWYSLKAFVLASNLGRFVNAKHQY